MKRVYCSECEFILPIYNYDSVVGEGGVSVEYSLCAHDKAEPYRDLVTKELPRCEMVRGNKKLCGITGEWYKEV